MLRIVPLGQVSAILLGTVIGTFEPAITGDFFLAFLGSIAFALIIYNQVKTAFLARKWPPNNLPVSIQDEFATRAQLEALEAAYKVDLIRIHERLDAFAKTASQSREALGEIKGTLGAMQSLMSKILDQGLNPNRKN